MRWSFDLSHTAKVVQIFELPKLSQKNPGKWHTYYSCSNIDARCNARSLSPGHRRYRVDRDGLTRDRQLRFIPIASDKADATRLGIRLLSLMHSGHSTSMTAVSMVSRLTHLEVYPSVST